MDISLNVQDQRGQKSTVQTDVVPDSCPLCHHGIEPVELGLGYESHIGSTHRVQRLFVCPRQQCQRFFIAVYYLDGYSSTFKLRTCLPTQIVDVAFKEVVSKVSEDFCQIYNQAHKAEQLGLTLVCGPGYRKALEFLIKDYVAALHPQAVDEIKRIQLGACISNYVNSEKVQLIAARAAWLGNDETHYIRKWDDKDLQDLKKLITLTCDWIEMEELTKQIVADMPDGKK